MPERRTQVSWRLPILAGALTTASLMLLVDLLRELGTPGLVAGACVCCGMLLPVGYLPAAIAFRADPTLTRAQGFAVAFIAVGIGTLVVTIQQVLRLQDLDLAALDRQLRPQIEELLRQTGGKEPAPEEIEAAVESMRRVVHYAPVAFAAFLTVVAGFVGMLTVGLLGGRRLPLPPGPRP
jgi:hypothetical protein